MTISKCTDILAYLEMVDEKINHCGVDEMNPQNICDKYILLLQAYSKIRLEQYAQSESACEAKTREKELIEIDLLKLENMAKAMDKSLSFKFQLLRQCADMDSLPLEKRGEALAFARAMTALEGTSTCEEVESGLAAWIIGQKSFFEVYIPVLIHLGILSNENEWPHLHSEDDI